MANEHEQLRVLQAQLSAMQKRMQALEDENTRLLERPAPIEELPSHEQPIYEVINESIFTADDQLFPPGVQFADKFGSFIPNENTMPLNDAAKARYAEWQRSLPLGGENLSLDAIVEAATMLRPRSGDKELNHIEFQTALIQKALELRNKPNSARRPVSLQPQRSDDAPLMSNVRIQGRDPVRKQALTSIVREPIAPADKAQPPVGSRADLIGRHAPAL